MSNSSSSSASGGIGFVGLLTIVFVALKLTGYIDWSWFWILSPLILSGVFWIAVIATALIIAGLVR